MDATVNQPRPRKGAHIYLPGRDYNHNNILCARSEARLTDAALSAGLMPCYPVTDIRGFDVVMEYRGKMRRAQLRACGFKAAAPRPEKMPTSFTFSILRVREKKKPNEEAYKTYRRNFHHNELDAFIFIHLDYNLIWIVPVDAMDLNRTKFTVRVGDCWQNNWGVLK